MENISGIIRIDIIPVESVKSLVIDPQSQQVLLFDPSPETDPIVHPWQTLYFTPGTANLSVNPKRDDSGTVFNTTLRWRTPKGSSQTSTFIRANLGCYFLARVTDGNGTTMLLGDTQFPARFSIAQSISEKPAGYNGYELNLTASQLTPMAYF